MLSNSHIYEKLQNKFCKQTLGIHRQTPDILAKAEMGRYPTMGNIMKQCYGFWQHVLNSDQNSLVFKALKVNIDLDRNGCMSYYTRIKSMLAIMDQKDKIYPEERSSQVKHVANNIRSKL